MAGAKDLNPLSGITQLVQQSIAEKYYPGAVILAAHQGEIIYRGVFGHQAVVPEVIPMHLDTIFDVASLTKVLVTAPAVMQCVEKGLVKLDAPAAQYWPEFAVFGKDQITLRALLTHTSGLPALIPSPQLNAILPAERQTPNTAEWRGKEAALSYIVNLSPISPSGTSFTYSDINFIVLGEMIERVSGQTLNQYADEHIFKPLGMHNTFFLPPASRRCDIAPTEWMDGVLRWGEVHDPTAWLMGGVAGMAGLFSTATDIGLFAEMILRGGAPILSQASVDAMTTPQTPAHMPEVRGLGWDIRSPFSCGGSHFSARSFGHTGWTGVSLWIDPDSHTWLIILTNRVHPHLASKNQSLADRQRIADIVGMAVNQIVIESRYKKKGQ